MALMKSKWASRLRLWWRWTQGSRLRLLIGCAALAAATVITSVLPLLLGRAAVAWPQLDPQLGLALAAGLAAQALCGAFGVYSLGVGAARLVVALRRQLFERLLAATSAFHNRQTSAELVAVLLNDAALVEQSLGTLLPILAQSLPLTVLAAGFLTAQSLRLTAGLALAGLPLAALALIAGRALRNTARDGQAALGRAAGLAQESLGGLWLLKTLNQEAPFAARFGAVTEQVFRARRRRAAWQALIEGLIPLGSVGLVVAGAWLAATSPLTVAAGLMSAAYLALLASGLLGLFRGYATLETTLGTASRVLQLVETVPAEVEHAEGRPLRQVKGAVRVEAVTFDYGSGQGVRDLSFTLRPGERVAVVGPNGSGKTTLLRLLMRLYWPAQGELYLDGQAAAQTSLIDWRRQFALVTRDPVIFDLTLAENIALGRPDATAFDIERASQAVGLDAVVAAWPEGYAARLGEGGARLSAGQRQRVALARIFLQAPAVLLLDEAANSLDRDGQAALTLALETWAADRTWLLAAPYRNPAWPVTRVLTLSAGRLIDDSSPAD